MEPLFANPPVMRVLIIDDDASVSAAIQMILVREGCDTVHAPDADAGIRAFERSRFDLVVVDLFMPGMDGLEIITEFRRRAPTLPVLAVSGFRFRDSADAGLDFLSLAANAGATICLRKPFSPQQLVAAIRASQNPAFPGRKPRTRIGTVTMTPNNSRLNILPSPARPHFAAQSPDQFQADLMSRALKRAIYDVGAAMTHQLSEPLTALLLYLNEIKRAGESSGGTETIPAAVRDMVDMALRETERVCDIMERVGHTVKTPIDSQTAVARGREAIDAWARSSDARGAYASTQPYVVQQPLTPREHEVLALITGGVSNKEGGHRLGISKRTFESHRAHLMGKCGAKNAADLVRMTLSQTEQQSREAFHAPRLPRLV